MSELICELSLPNGRAVFNLEIYEEDGRMICGVRGLYGELHEPPKQWLRTVRAQMAIIEQQAREAGCEEMRIAGRWARVFPDYQPFVKLSQGLRKGL